MASQLQRYIYHVLQFEAYFKRVFKQSGKIPKPLLRITSHLRMYTGAAYADNQLPYNPCLEGRT
eukprot:11242066-Karenia_brevis.AAC.1